MIVKSYETKLKKKKEETNYGVHLVVLLKEKKSNAFNLRKEKKKIVKTWEYSGETAYEYLKTY